MCFFSKILIYFPDSVFSRCQCVYTHQAGWTPALQQNWQSSEKFKNFKEKNTIINEQPVFQTKPFFTILRAGTKFKNKTISLCNVCLPRPTLLILLWLNMQLYYTTPTCLNWHKLIYLLVNRFIFFLIYFYFLLCDI